MKSLFAVLVATCLVACVLSVPAPAVEPQSVSEKDGTPAPVFEVNLDLPAEQRWNSVLAVYGERCKEIVNIFKKSIPDYLQPLVVKLSDTAGEDLQHRFGKYAGEIQGIASNLQLPFGEVFLLNFMYELSALCTSIVAQTADGEILQARNLDFGEGGNFTELLNEITIAVNFTQNGQVLYHGVTYVGYVGTWTAMKPGVVSVTADERFDKDVIGNFYEILLNKNSRAVSTTIREVIESATSYEEAVSQLSSQELIAPTYLIVGGVSPGQGVVITRERTKALDLWFLNSTTDRWFLVETNYDHWKQPTPGDDRRDPAIKAMNAMGQSALTLDGLYNVLSVHPVLNKLTTYTSVIHTRSGYIYTRKRYCGADCPV